MSVKLELYRVFKEVAEAGNITAAAQTLFISQSAVSQSIKQLEAELQTRLFARNSRGVTLTGWQQTGPGHWRFAFEAPADFLRTDDPQTIRTELTDIRDTAYDISSRMMRSLEQSKAPRQSEQER